MCVIWSTPHLTSPDLSGEGFDVGEYLGAVFVCIELKNPFATEYGILPAQGFGIKETVQAGNERIAVVFGKK